MVRQAAQVDAGSPSGHFLWLATGSAFRYLFHIA
jgi:hypothetical protein